MGNIKTTNSKKQIKTGILTLSSAQNYGAVLQCYSLCCFLNKNFSYTEIINFTPKFIIGRYPLFKFNFSSFFSFFRSLISQSFYFPIKLLKKIRFHIFRKNFCNYSPLKYQISYNDDDYNQYIVGSDQVFNLDLTQNEKEFFLPHIKDNRKKASYAASLGVSNLKEEQKFFFKEYLDSFSHISLREETGKSLLQNILKNKEIIQSIDPVFLTTKNEWEKISKKRIIKRNYILIYSFKAFDVAYDIAKQLKQEQDIDIVSISDRLTKLKSDVTYQRGVGPKEFLSLVQHADYIITDSFHGTAFSIIFNKNFTAIPYKGTESRFIDMLSKFSLTNRIAYSISDLKNSIIDYETVNLRIKEYTQESYKYFKKVYS